MVAAGLIVEFVFQGAGLVPHSRHAKVEMASVSWNYTTVLNIVFLVVAALLVWRLFPRGGGWQMLRMMNEPMTGTASLAPRHTRTRTDTPRQRRHLRALVTSPSFIGRDCPERPPDCPGATFCRVEPTSERPGGT